MTGTNTGVLDIYQGYVDRFDGELSKGTAFTWTPFRFCSDDWLLAVAVVRANRRQYDVALLAAEDHRDFEPDAGLKAALAFMLADSFHRTGKMSLRFCGPHRNEPMTLESGYCRGIPPALRRLAKSMEVELEHGRVLSHEEGRKLYCVLMGITQQIIAKLEELSVDPVRCAFLMHRGVLTRESLLLFAYFSADPAALIEGKLRPERWLMFKRELVLLRRGLLAERVRVLLELGVQREREPIRLAWASPSSVRFSNPCGIKLENISGSDFEISPNQKVEIHLLARDETEMKKLALKVPKVPAGSRVLVAFTRDVLWLPHHQRLAIQDGFQKRGIEVITIHEALDELDSEALLRLERFQTTRMSIEEQKE